jgi:membrane fusion protein (multidrug efflux system)
MSRRRIAIYIGIALLAAFVLFKIGEKVFIMIKMRGHRGMPPTPVEIAKAQQQQWQDQIHSTGTISAIQGVMIAPQVSGQITKIYFTSGTDVKKGDLLFQIYPDILEAQLANNKAALSLAQVNYDRATVLYQKKVASKEQLDQYTTELQQAQANLAQTQAQLVQHNIVAPFSGRIGLKMVDEGNFVNVGQNLVSLQQMNPMRVDFYVPDRYINSLKIGDAVEVKPSSADDNTVYVGNVYAFNSNVDPDTRSFSMWAQIPNPDEDLIPGTYVDITMYVGKPHPVITVPQTAALFSPQGEYVYTVADGKATKTQVTVGMRENNWIEIKSGLKAGDTVVTAGQVKLYDGAPIVIAPTSTYAAENPPAIKYVTFPKGQPLTPEEPTSLDITTNSTGATSPAPATTTTPASTNNTATSTDAKSTSVATPTDTNKASSTTTKNVPVTTAPAGTKSN